MDIEDVFRDIKRHMGILKMVEVARIRPEHKLEYKRRQMLKNKIQDEMKQYIIKLKVLDAQRDEINSELWSWLYKEYGLPSDLRYEIDRDGIITKEVEEKQPKEHE